MMLQCTCAQRVRLVSSEILVSSAFALCPCLSGRWRDNSGSSVGFFLTSIIVNISSRIAACSSSVPLVIMYAGEWKRHGKVFGNDIRICITMYLHTTWGKQNVSIFMSRFSANLHARNTLLSVSSSILWNILQSQLKAQFSTEEPASELQNKGNAFCLNSIRERPCPMFLYTRKWDGETFCRR